MQHLQSVIRRHVSLAHLQHLCVQGQANIELLELCAAPAWAALLHVLTVSERQLAMDNAYACVTLFLICFLAKLAAHRAQRAAIS